MLVPPRAGPGASGSCAHVCDETSKDHTSDFLPLLGQPACMKTVPYWSSLIIPPISGWPLIGSGCSLATEAWYDRASGKGELGIGSRAVHFFVFESKHHTLPLSSNGAIALPPLPPKI